MDNDPGTGLGPDLKTAALSGGGLGLALLGFVIPVLSLAGLVVSYLGLRSAREEYRVGRVFAIAGIAAGIVGTGMLVVEAIGVG